MCHETVKNHYHTSEDRIDFFGWHTCRQMCREYQNLDLKPGDEQNRRNMRIHYIVIVVLTFSTQLVLFNSAFVLIGVVAAPVETGSLLMLYIASLFSLISFIALIFKVFHHIAMKEKEQTEASRALERERGDSQLRSPKVILKRSYIAGLILLVFILAAGIGVTVSFIYIYTVLNQEYRNNRGIMGALLPPVLASTSGFFWARIIPCVGKPNKQENGREEVLDELSQVIFARQQSAETERQRAETKRQRRTKGHIIKGSSGAITQKRRIKRQQEAVHTARN